MLRKDEVVTSRVELDATGRLWLEGDRIGKISFESFHAETEFRDWIDALWKERAEKAERAELC